MKEASGLFNSSDVGEKKALILNVCMIKNAIMVNWNNRNTVKMVCNEKKIAEILKK